MSDLKIKNRRDKFETLAVEFSNAVEAICKNPEVLTGLKESLSELLEIDARIQDLIRDTSLDSSKSIVYRQMEHDFTYVWLGLRQFNEPLLKRSSIVTLEETHLSLIELKEHFESDMDPVLPLERVISVIKALDYSQKDLHPSPR